MVFGDGFGGDGARSVPGSAYENGSVKGNVRGRGNACESACDETGCAPVYGTSCCVSVLYLCLALDRVRGHLCRVGVLCRVLGLCRVACRGLTLWTIAAGDGRDGVQQFPLEKRE